MVSECQRLSQVFGMSQGQGCSTGEAQVLNVMGCMLKRPQTGRDKGHSTELSEGPGEAQNVVLDGLGIWLDRTTAFPGRLHQDPFYTSHIIYVSPQLNMNFFQSREYVLK